MSAILKQKLIDIANGFTKYGLWKGGGSSALSEMTDVSFTNLQTNDVLTYNGSKWVNDDNLQTQINTLNSILRNMKILKVSVTSSSIAGGSYSNIAVDYTEEMRRYRTKFIAEVEPKGLNYVHCNVLQASSSDKIYIKLGNTSSSSQVFNVDVKMMCIL